MTVKELIEKLQKFDSELPIGIWKYSVYAEENDIYDIDIVEEYRETLYPVSDGPQIKLWVRLKED